MKVTIDLTAAQVQGIKAYLKETDATYEMDGRIPTNKDVQELVQSEAIGYLTTSGAIADHIQAAERALEGRAHG